MGADWIVILVLGVILVGLFSVGHPRTRRYYSRGYSRARRSYSNSRYRRSRRY